MTLLSRVTGLVRELFIATMFGASAMTDAFNVAFRIPNLFRRFFADGAFSQAFVPVLAASKIQDGDKETCELINQTASILAWAVMVLSLIGIALAPFLVWVMASGLNQNPRSFDVAVVLTRWMFPYISFMSLVALGAGVLNTWRHFAVPAVTPVLLNVSIILVAALLAPEFEKVSFEPIYALGIGVLIGGISQLGLQIIALKKLGLMPRIYWKWKDLNDSWKSSGTQKIILLMGPAILGVSVAHISMIINTQIASHLPSGSVSWVTYADRLMEFPSALLGVALGVVLIPQLSKARANGDTKEYSNMLDWGLRIVVLLASPCAIALLVFAKPLVSVIFHYGVMSTFDIDQITFALMGWGVGLIGIIAVKVLAPAYYAAQDTKTPVKIAVVVLVLTQILNFFWVPIFAHAALTLSIGIGALVNAAWLLMGLIKSGTYKPADGWIRFLCQVILGNLCLAGVLFWINGLVDWTEMTNQKTVRVGYVFMTLAVSAFIYFLVLSLSGFKLRVFMRR